MATATVGIGDLGNDRTHRELVAGGTMGEHLQSRRLRRSAQPDTPQRGTRGEVNSQDTSGCVRGTREIHLEFDAIENGEREARRVCCREPHRIMSAGHLDDGRGQCLRIDRATQTCHGAHHMRGPATDGEDLGGGRFDQRIIGSAGDVEAGPTAPRGIDGVGDAGDRG